MYDWISSPFHKVAYIFNVLMDLLYMYNNDFREWNVITLTECLSKIARVD